MAKKKTSARNTRPGNQQGAAGRAAAARAKATAPGSTPTGAPKAASKPATTTKPAARPPAAKPTSTKPASAKPASAKPASAKPASAKPASAKPPAAAKPASAKPPAPAKPPAAAKPPATKPSSKPKAPGVEPSRPRGGPTRGERLAAAEKARHRRSMQVRGAVAGAVAVVVLVVGFLVVSNNKDRANEAAGFETGACDFDRKSDGDAGAGRNHVADPTYKVDPPAGGDHNPTAAPAGTYTEENKPPDGQLVHSLEHGYVIIWYRPDLPADQLASLQELTQRHAKDVLLVPRSSLDQPVAATAWHARLLCGTPDVATLERFVDRYVNQGPEKVLH